MRQAGDDTAKASFGGRPASRRTASSTLRRNDPEYSRRVRNIYIRQAEGRHMRQTHKADI